MADKREDFWFSAGEGATTIKASYFPDPDDPELWHETVTSTRSIKIAKTMKATLDNVGRSWVEGMRFATPDLGDLHAQWKAFKRDQAKKAKKVTT